MARQLIKAGITLDEGKRKGRPVIFFAVENNAVEFSDLMIANGASINVLDNNENTAIHYVVGRALPETVQYLLDSGIKWENKNKSGQTALDIAAVAGNTENLLLLYDKATNVQRADAFMASVASGVTTSVAALLEKGVDKNQRNKHQQTALMVASSNRHHQVVELLLTNDFDINAVDDQGRDALMTVTQH